VPLSRWFPVLSRDSFEKNLNIVEGLIRQCLREGNGDCARQLAGAAVSELEAAIEGIKDSLRKSCDPQWRAYALRLWERAGEFHDRFLLSAPDMELPDSGGMRPRLSTAEVFNRYGLLPLRFPWGSMPPWGVVGLGGAADVAGVPTSLTVAGISPQPSA